MSGTNGVKISQLTRYTGTPAPTGDIPISIAGTTYKIDPSLLNRPGTGSGSMNFLDEFEVGAAGYVIGAEGSALSDANTYNNIKLANVNGVVVYMGGTLVPNIVLSVGGPRVAFTLGSALFTFAAGFTNKTHVLILTY